MQKNKTSVGLGAFLLACAFAVLVWQNSSGNIKNMVRASDDELRDALMGDKPHAFYCVTGFKGEENLPTIFTELNNARGNQYQFAIVDCLKKMPSGKSMMERFELNRKNKPVMFTTAPWFAGRAKQVPQKALKDGIKSVKKYIDKALAPRATEIVTDKDLNKYCGFNKNTYTTDDKSIGNTCIALLKGKRHSATHVTLEEKLIKENPRVKYISIDATKRTLSFEDTESGASPDNYGLKVHALRNGTHFMSMVNPITWDYLSTFASHAIGTPLYSFEGDSDTSIVMKKAMKSSSAFRDRSFKGPSSSSSDDDKSSDKSKPEYNEAEKIREPTSEEIEEKRLEKERKAREYMDKLERESLFEEGDDSAETHEDDNLEEGTEEEEEEDEDLIEL